MKLSLISIERDLIRLEADGPVTAADFPADSKPPFETLLGVTWMRNAISLDFEKVSAIDSSAIGWLIATNKALKDGGGKLVLHSMQPLVRQVLTLVRVDKAIKIAVNEEQARQMLTEGAAK